MTIEELSEKLSLWRQSKKSKRDRIPLEYWNEAVKFANESSCSIVASKLGLGITDLKKRMRNSASPQEKIIFKELPVVPQKKQSVLVEFTTPSGMSIRVYS